MPAAQLLRWAVPWQSQNPSVCCSFGFLVLSPTYRHRYHHSSRPHPFYELPVRILVQVEAVAEPAVLLAEQWRCWETAV